MYHIFLTFIIATSQNQVSQTKQYIEQQKNDQTIITQSIKTASQSSVKSNNKQDVIASLKVENEIEENALKPDLESMGLDQIDVLEAPEKNIEAVTADKTKNITKAKNLPATDLSKISKKENNDSGTFSLPQINNTKSKGIDKKTEEIINTKKDVEKNNKVTEEKVADEQKQLQEIPEEKTTQPNPKDKKPSGILSKPIDKIKKLFSKKEDFETTLLDKIEDTKKDTEAEKVQIEESTTSYEAKKNKQKKAEQRRQKQILLNDLRQKQKTEKLEKLRQAYLKEGEGDDVFEGITKYQMVSKIIPKQKIPPKFVNDEVVAPPLLNRFRGQENKHHPIIMSRAEKINFMFQSVAENKIDEFNSLYALIKDPNIKNSFGDTLLTFAVLMRRYDAVSSLLSKGANPDLANDLGYTPLNIAIELADYNMTSILIEMGANVDLVDDLGRTYLMQSSRVGSLPITDLLIHNGTNVNFADNNGTTALALAYKYKKDVIAKYLLKYGAKNWIKKGYNDGESSMINDLFNKWE